MKILSMPVRTLVPFLLAGALSAVFSAGVLAQRPDAQLAATGLPVPGLESPSQPTVESAPDYRLTLEQLGARYPINLRGVDGSDSVGFNVRADEVVRSAQLNLGYTYSPALLSELSHINILLNDEVAVSLPVPHEEAGKRQQRTIELPAHLITEFNQLRMQLIGHYTLECEDPLHSSLWTNVSNKSQLEMSVERLSLPNDLSILPLPFFDRRDVRRLELPFVFMVDPDAATLESAGMLASWFGALAAYRGAQFPVHMNGGFPDKGNAIVLIKGSSSALGSLSVSQTNGPALAIVTNPNDANGKLLLLMGHDGKELKQAAQALVSGGQTLAGPTATVTGLEQLKPRQAYDAPNWLRSDRPVKLGELIALDSLGVSGYGAGPVDIAMRPAPDLFGWRAKPVPLDLRYRYTPQPGQANSSLLLNAGDRFLKSFALLSLAQLEDGNGLEAQASDEMLPVRAKVEVPLSRLMSGAGLQFRFMYDYIKEGKCRDIIIDNVRGQIDPESTIDLSDYPHFMPMPNLAAFKHSGFPFTRMADLSETAVVFAERASTHDFSTYLTLMGRFGESTGYPATAVTVAFGQGGLKTADKDLVVISSGSQSWLSAWASHMPVALNGQNKRFGISDLVYKARIWQGSDPRETEQQIRSNLSYTSAGANVVFSGFESPAQSGRSVVLIASGQPEGQLLASRALLSDEGYEQGLQGSLAVVKEGLVQPLAAEYSYAVGTLGFWRGLEWRLAQYLPNMPPWLIVVLAIAFVLVLAAALWRIWRRNRLSGEQA